jgi:hypothetical protein
MPDRPIMIVWLNGSYGKSTAKFATPLIGGLMGQVARRSPMKMSRTSHMVK